MVCGMATHPIDTAKLYALTSEGACTATLTMGEKSITWDVLSEGGQTTIIVPAGATVSISGASALLSPLPANFKAALGAAVKSTGGQSAQPMLGEQMQHLTCDDTGCCELTMRHSTWCILPQDATSCALATSGKDGLALSMQLVLTPGAHMNEGWLRAASAEVIWLYGEPIILSGHTYIIGLTQIAADKVLANILATLTI